MTESFKINISSGKGRHSIVEQPRNKERPSFEGCPSLERRFVIVGDIHVFCIKKRDS